MIEFTGSEGLFNLRATFEGAPPQDETICMYATWTEVGAPIIVTPSSVSSVGATTASNTSFFVLGPGIGVLILFILNLVEFVQVW
jgi:hypothetical protein